MPSISNVTDTENALQVENLTRSFILKSGQSLSAVKDLNFYVKPGEFVTLLGPSGCGKSTTFTMIAGLLPPSSGKVVINNHDVTGQTGHVGYMFQKDLLLPWRSVLDNMILGAEVMNQDRKAAREEARELLTRFGLEGTEHFFPGQLSGGMRQRVAFGRTLMFHKELMLLDEPLGALDSQTREYMQEWLLQVWEEFKKTVLLISHDLDEAIFLSDRIYVLSSQPGHVKAEIKVDLPRPRRAESRLSPRYAEIRMQVYKLIREEEKAM
jgi:ABC-type nitrate/sulfonate/bicarbonate transport system ATPase subunit